MKQKSDGNRKSVREKKPRDENGRIAHEKVEQVASFPKQAVEKARRREKEKGRQEWNGKVEKGKRVNKNVDWCGRR